MRLLWISHHPVFGGPHNLAMRMAGALQDRGFEVVALLPSGQGSAEARLREAGVEVVQMPLHRLRASKDVREHLWTATTLLPETRRIAKLIEEREIGLVVLGGLTNPHGAMAARRAGVPAVWQILDTRVPPPLRRTMMRYAVRTGSALMFTGQAVQDLHLGDREPDLPCFLFTAVADTDSLRPVPGRREEIRRRLGVPGEALFVGTIANVNPQKGIEYFVRAAPEIHAAREDARFLILGHTYDTHRGYLAGIREEIARSAVPDERFILLSEPVHDQYLALDAKLIASVPRSEGTPTTAIEAMACGVPVVATDVGSVSEIVVDGVTGLVVPPEDPAALARATLRIAADPELGRRLGAAGRERAVERYGLEPVARVHADAFNAALERFAQRGGGG